MQISKRFAFASMIVFGAGLAYADQMILGNSFLLKNPSTPDKRKIVGKGKEKGSPNTIVGDPALGTGGVLTVSASGGTPGVQVFALPQGTSGITGKAFWSGTTAKGFKYKDPKGEQGPVKVVQIKKSASGTFTIKAVAVGKNGVITVLPPNPGTAGCVLLSINGGDSYSVQFGATSLITNKGAQQFKAKKPTVEGSCITPTTTTSTTATPTTSTSSTTTTTAPYGSPSRAFVERVLGILD
jgi:hypothetical protein